MLSVSDLLELETAQLIATIQPYAPKPEWEDAIRQAIRLISGTNRASTISEILEYGVLDSTNDPYEPYIHRRLLLAGLIIADVPDHVDPNLAEYITRQLWDRWFALRVRPWRFNSGTVLAGLLSTPLDAVLLPRIFDLIATKQEVWRLRPFVNDIRVRHTLLALLEDENKDVRREACWLFVGYGTDPEVRMALLKRFSDAVEGVRWAAVGVLGGRAADPATSLTRLAIPLFGQEVEPAPNGQASHPEVRVALLQIVADKSADYHLRRLAIESLDQLVDDPDARSILLELISDPHSNVAIDAVMILKSRAYEPDLQETLLKLLKRKSYRVRANVITALSDQSIDPKVRKALLKLLWDSNWVIRSRAISALSKQADEPETRSALLSLLNDSEKWVRQEAVEALAGQLDDPPIQNSILTLVDDSDHSVRYQVGRALAPYHNNPLIRESLSSLLNDSDDFVRRMTVQALGKYSDSLWVRDRLLESLKDSDDWVQEEAVRALWERGDDPVVRDTFLQRLNTSSESVQSTIIHALESYAHYEEVRTMLRLLLDSAESELILTAVVGAFAGAVRDYDLIPRFGAMLAERRLALSAYYTLSAWAAQDNGP